MTFHDILHKFAGGYGWDRAKVLALPAADFLGYLKAMFKQEEKELTDRLKISAHTGWQIRNLLAGFVGGKEISFTDHLQSLGLLSEKEQQLLYISRIIENQQSKKEAREHVELAEKILEMYRGKRERA